MNIVDFKKHNRILGDILEIKNKNNTIIYSLGNNVLQLKDIVKLMSKVMFSNIYSLSLIKIKLLENISENLIEAQIKAFYFFKYEAITYKNNKKEKKYIFELIHSDSKRILELIEKNKLIVKFINEIKDLIEMPPELIFPESLLNYTIDFSKKNNLTILDIYHEFRLKNEGFNGVLSVGKGSHNPPKMIVLEWSGTSNHKENGIPVTYNKPIILVGKGVTYDSGGYSIKIANGMKNMKRDKTGVCVILGIMGVLAKINYSNRVIAILPMAENVISSESYKPDDIIHSYSKKTVEVYNTDAEGRLLLMDGLTLAKVYNPNIIIDVATLTSVGTFCGHYGAIFTNNNELAWKLQKYGENVGDRFWVLPISEEMIEDTQNTKMANVKNDGYKCYSTTTSAAAFLHNFVSNEIPWLHIDLGESESIYEKYNKNNSNSTNSFLMLLEFLLNY